MHDHPPRQYTTKHHCVVGHRWGEPENTADRYCIDCGVMWRQSRVGQLYWLAGAGDHESGSNDEPPCPASLRGAGGGEC